MVRNTYKVIFQYVNQIPYGKVATYGQIARLAGIPNGARQIGYALNRLEDNTIPWHRVLNAKGKISHRSNSDYEILQKTLLEAEGIIFTQDEKIDMHKYQWRT